MAAILCIETATTNCSVALSIDGSASVLIEDFNTSYSHGERLQPYLDQVLQKAGLGYSDLDAIAVSQGPGSYTGLRIGVSAAKGLCFSLDIPLIAIDTLSSLARQVKTSQGTIIAMLDARRMEVYSRVFDSEYNALNDVAPVVLTPESYSAYLEQGTVLFVGNSNEKFKEICKHPNAKFEAFSLPSAKELCGLAQAKFDRKAFEDVAYFEPFYLKSFRMG
ncbi:MAG: tRNA (adenosine(37)-N6)-threonylcarbamoyltransferase complex dimerization subunit type 1 TsaB [Gilvibacter sp.]